MQSNTETLLPVHLRHEMPDMCGVCENIQGVRFPRQIGTHENYENGQVEFFSKELYYKPRGKLYIACLNNKETIICHYFHDDCIKTSVSENFIDNCDGDKILMIVYEYSNGAVQVIRDRTDFYKKRTMFEILAQKAEKDSLHKITALAETLKYINSISEYYAEMVGKSQSINLDKDIKIEEKRDIFCELCLDSEGGEIYEVKAYCSAYSESRYLWVQSYMHMPCFNIVDLKTSVCLVCDKKMKYSAIVRDGVVKCREYESNGKYISIRYITLLCSETDAYKKEIVVTHNISPEEVIDMGQHLSHRICQDSQTDCCFICREQSVAIRICQSGCRITAHDNCIMNYIKSKKIICPFCRKRLYKPI